MHVVLPANRLQTDYQVVQITALQCERTVVKQMPSTHTVAELKLSQQSASTGELTAHHALTVHQEKGRVCKLSVVTCWYSRHVCEGLQDKLRGERVAGRR